MRRKDVVPLRTGFRKILRACAESRGVKVKFIKFLVYQIWPAKFLNRVAIAQQTLRKL